MITDKELTNWLFYQSPLKHALDTNEYVDPKYLELNFPHREVFKNKLLSCSLKDFVGTLIWVLKDKYPWEYRYIKTGQMQWDEKNRELIENTNIRELQDIYPLEFNEEVIGYLRSLKIRFKTPQLNIHSWIEEVIEGKIYTKEIVGEVTKYIFTDSLTKNIEATKDYILINIHEEKIDEFL